MSMKNNITLIVMVVGLIVFIQLFRLGALFGKDDITHTLKVDFDINKAINLSQTEKDVFHKEKFLIIYGDDENELVNLEKTLGYLKVDYEAILSSKALESYSGYDMIILLDHQMSRVIDIEKLLLYAKEGGKLFYLIDGSINFDPLFKNYAETFGIKSFEKEIPTNEVRFNTEILTGIIGELNVADPQNDSFYAFEPTQVELLEDCIIYMESQDGIPMIWKRSLENGIIMTLNLGAYDDKEKRGLLAGGISLLKDYFVYPIINSEVVFIDDFPADYISNPEILKVNYGRDTQRYLLEIWWPDMVSLMKKYGLIYTGAFVETYNNQIEGPFEDNEQIETSTKRLVSDIMKFGGEISFHGYNHQSLLFDQTESDAYGYKAWKSDEDIVEAIKHSISFYKTMYPNYDFYTYVPASNLLDPAAIKDLKEAIPSLKTISSVYVGEVDENNQQNLADFDQEFGFDDRYGVALPRVSSGAFLDDNLLYTIASAITVNGIVNHFIHPDDSIEVDRSHGLIWGDLYKEYDHLFGTIYEKYPWLEEETVSDASEKVEAYTYSEVYYHMKGRTLTISADHFQNEMSVIVVMDQNILSGTDCEFEQIDSHRYLIKMHKNFVSLEVD